MMAGLRTIRIWSLACVIAIATLIAPMTQAHAQGLIRDAEIEELLREYANPMFRAAGLSPRSVKVYIIADSTLNAFVAGGQRVFVHTGLLTRTRTPNELRGVLAHETGHIAGAHLAKLGIAIDNMSTQNILAMLLAAAAVAGGAATGNSAVAQSGQGIMLGGAEIAKRNLLAYVRVQESAADQAAAKYMRRTGHSMKGMLDLFQRMGNRSLAASQFADPYTRSHPMEFDRIRALRTEAKKSPHYNKKENPKTMHRHKLMQAKLIGYLSPNQVVRRFPPGDDTTAAHYARAIAHFRQGKMQKSVDELNILVKREPKNAYFWELAGEALLNGGQIDHAIKALKRA
ncbi:MAG: M48 family metalloprotease, partial [Hyphomicrobiales bacterium]